MSEKITIREIAEEACVSVATVSYIINGLHEERYSRETKQRVLQIVNLRDYHPSKIAQSYARSKTNNIILLTDKHESVLQKAESFDFIRMLGKALEKHGLNLLIRSYLEATRIDTANAIICAGTQEETFRKIAAKNFVPFLTVDARIHDNLFFQVFQDFHKVMAAGEAKFGKDNFSVVLVDMYNETHKEEIRAICGDVVFLTDNGLENVPKGNIVTVNSMLPKLSELKDREFLLCPALTDDRIDAIIDCYKKASDRVSVDTHVILV